jgi:oxygen-independent coproporphyrinogen-3 oxidase
MTEGLLPRCGRRIAASSSAAAREPAENNDRLLSEVRARLTLEPGAEVTLEANPGTVEAARFRGYREAGVNRLSLGVQSFDDAMLKALGRIHSADEARRALDVARDTFGNVNLDLMYGLPGQTLAMARADIDEAVRRAPAHVSAYQLTIEPNTVFWSQRPRLPEHDLCADMQEMAETTLAAAGFEHYETSAFARPARRSRHNLNYWEFGDYLGIGAGAHGKISFADRITRHARAKPPRAYMLAALRGDSAVEQRDVSARELPFEFMLNAARLVEGFAPELFAARTGLPAAALEPGLRAAEHKGLIERSATRIRPSERGRRFLNDLQQMFLRPPGGKV